ncbi:MAG: DUF192 domain-containing protein [Patescibacteria group bacterium]
MPRRITKPLQTSDPTIRYRVLALLILAVAFVMIVLVVSRGTRPVASKGITDLSSLRIEIVDKDAGRMRGLSGRTSLDQDAGMLFVFDERGFYPFWMKEMLFPLDIVWIDEGKVVDVATLQPPKEGKNIPPSHIPFAQADRVLELNAGMAGDLGLVKGATVTLPK